MHILDFIRAKVVIEIVFKEVAFCGFRLRDVLLRRATFGTFSLRRW